MIHGIVTWHTHIVSQRDALSRCKVGSQIRVRYVGGSMTTYRITAIKGDQARELELEGVRGAKRWLVDGGDRLWLKDPTAAKRKGRNESGGHRRVISIEVLSSPELDISAARARMPDGYMLGAVDRGFTALTDYLAGGRANAVPEEVGPVRASAWEAVCDAWDQALRVASGESMRAAHTLDQHVEREAKYEAMLEARRADATRCRVALRQLLELARGVPPSGCPLENGMSPEAVVAAVGHALRVESMKGSTLPF
jgi:hypothetical protein